jgi:hypothetical protein
LDSKICPPAFAKEVVCRLIAEKESDGISSPLQFRIAEGHQPPDLTVFSLMRPVDLPLLWNAQEQALVLR